MRASSHQPQGNMDKKPVSQAEAEELLAMLETLEANGRQQDIPQDLKELVKNVKRRKGEAVDEKLSQELIPEPGFVVKTSDAESKKVFLNICGSAKVDAPGGFSDGKIMEEVQKSLDKLQQDGEELSEQELQSLRLPLSCGEPRSDQDHKGDPCTTIDIVFNSDVIKQSAALRSLKFFIINVAMEWVGQKFGTKLDPKFKLPKMKYKGHKVQPQSIRMERKALVKELGDVLEDPVFPLLTKKPNQPKPVAAAAATPSTSSRPADKADSSQHLEAVGQASTSGRAAAQRTLTYSTAFTGKPVSSVLVEVMNIPSDVAMAHQVQVHGCMRDVQVVVDNCRPLQISLPFAVEAAQATAELARGKLELQLPICSMRSVVEQLRRQAPHAPGSIQLSNSSYMELEV